ncbi:hypothetical protein QTI68_38835 [Variovorax sp. J31P207]|nr:hypothetical protein [Variovorax sp. J31P207]MDM0072516.1 hypothetical protein [Variovorax sp. J31P207]
MTSSKPWLASYDTRIPAEIDPNRYASVVHLFEDAMQRSPTRPPSTASAKRSALPTATATRAPLPPTFRNA